MRDGKMIYAVDFDGTLSHATFPECGNPDTILINWLIDRRKKGHKVILWTCRMYENLEAAVQWCKEQGLEFDAVNRDIPELEEFYGLKPGDYHPKIYADYYIDDKNASIFLFDIADEADPGYAFRAVSLYSHYNKKG